MTKPRGITWLEEQTEQQLDRPSLPPKSRHVSIRVPDELFDQLERLATQRGESVSQCARRLLLDGLTDEREPTLAIDEAISALQRARDQLAS